MNLSIPARLTINRSLVEETLPGTLAYDVNRRDSQFGWNNFGVDNFGRTRRPAIAYTHRNIRPSCIASMRTDMRAHMRRLRFRLGESIAANHGWNGGFTFEVF